MASPSERFPLSVRSRCDDDEIVAADSQRTLDARVSSMSIDRNLPQTRGGPK